MKRKLLRWKAIPVSLNQLLPENHPVFNDRAPEEHDNFLFTKEAICPVCKTSFEVPVFRCPA